MVVYAGNTQKVKVSAGKSATAAKNAVKSGGKSLADDDTKTTVGTLSKSQPILARIVSCFLFKVVEKPCVSILQRYGSTE